MRKFLILIVLIASFGVSVPAFAQEPAPSGACSVQVTGGKVAITGDLSLCTEADLKLIVDHLQEQLGASGSTANAVKLPELTSTMTSGVWEVKLYPGVTEDMLTTLKELGNYAPDELRGQTLFNEDYDGMSSRNFGEFPEVQESAYCESDDKCKVITPTGHFRYAAGDGPIQAIGEECYQTDGIGCVRILINFGTVDAAFDANLKSNYSFAGRYWNDGLIVDEDGKEIVGAGRAMPVFLWGLTSYAANVMTNAASELNPEGVTNAGSNCSSRQGCTGVRIAVYFLSGNQLLASATTIYMRPNG